MLSGPKTCQIGQFTTSAMLSCRAELAASPLMGRDAAGTIIVRFDDRSRLQMERRLFPALEITIRHARLVQALIHPHSECDPCSLVQYEALGSALAKITSVCSQKNIFESEQTINVWF